MPTTTTESIRRHRLLLALLASLLWVRLLAAGSPGPQGMVRAGKPEASAPSTKLPKPINLHGLPNLSLVKEELIAYHDCTRPRPCYGDDLVQVGRMAIDYLRHYVKVSNVQGGRDAAGHSLAVIIDVDETALSNWESMRRQDFAYSRAEFLKWEQEAWAPAIQPTLELFRFAQENRLAIFFLTGRAEAEREWTVKDLEGAGYKNWTRLIMRQMDSPRFAVDYKTAERKKLFDSGYRIILSLGDQDSDLAGPFAGKTFKLPNPFYYLR